MSKFFARTTKDFLLAVLAGMSISLGCFAFLASGNKIVGSLFFVVGLFLILNFNFNLFTGKVCYSLDNKPSYIFRLINIWIGNFVGAIIFAMLIRASQLDGIKTACETVANNKLDGSLLNAFILGIFCNLLVFVAVHGYKNFDNALSKTIALFFGVSVFVLCGYEHCIADMCYFVLAGAWTGNMFLHLLVITLGNCVGGLFLPVMMKLIKFLEKKETEEIDENKAE